MATPFPQDLERVRKQPTVTVALLVFLGYAAIITAANRAFASDVDFGEIAASAQKTRQGVVVPVGIATLYLVVVASVLGWWRPALMEPRRRLPMPKWLWAIPAIALAGPLLDLFRSKHFGDFTNSHIVWLAIAFCLVGFSEELMTRGLLLTGLRTKLSEDNVALWTALLFALMHGLNIFFGQDVGTTVKQVIGTFPMGLLFYMCRRITGTLVTAMVLHALVDFSLVIFGGPDSTLNQLDPNEGLPLGTTAALGLTFVAILVHNKKLFRSIDDTAV